MARVLSGSRVLPWALAFATLLCAVASAQETAESVPKILTLPSAFEIMLRKNPLLLRVRQKIPFTQAGVQIVSG